MKILKDYAKANNITINFDTMPLKSTNSPGYVSSVDIKGIKYGGGGMFVKKFKSFCLEYCFCFNQRKHWCVLLHIIYYHSDLRKNFMANFQSLYETCR